MEARSHAGIGQQLPAVTDKAEFSLLTWNVWFDDYQFTARVDHICKFIESADVDVVCLQEVTPRFIFQLRDQSWLTKYDVSDDLQGSSVGSYGIVMLCKKELSAAYKFTRFPSGMGRSLLSTRLLLRGAEFCVGTVHLESLNNASLRKQQLEICRDTLDTYDYAVLCGDFNFCSFRNFGPADGASLENDATRLILCDYLDIWPTLIPPPNLFGDADPSRTPPSRRMIHTALNSADVSVASNLGFTFDSVRNPMLSHFERMRYDRIMFKSGNSEVGIGWIASSIEMVGTDAINDNGDRPSDHFGLLARFKLTTRN
jgi:hypothetical protein